MTSPMSRGLLPKTLSVETELSVQRVEMTSPMSRGLLQCLAPYNHSTSSAASVEMTSPMSRGLLLSFGHPRVVMTCLLEVEMTSPMSRGLLLVAKTKASAVSFPSGNDLPDE